ncbi:MAG: hypothetical protein ACFFCS_00275 [Candidatus Hodarchaeota archaeon]
MNSEIRDNVKELQKYLKFKKYRWDQTRRAKFAKKKTITIAKEQEVKHVEVSVVEIDKDGAILMSWFAPFMCWVLFIALTNIFRNATEISSTVLFWRSIPPTTLLILYITFFLPIPFIPYLVRNKFDKKCQYSFYVFTDKGIYIGNEFHTYDDIEFLGIKPIKPFLKKHESFFRFYRDYLFNHLYIRPLKKNKITKQIIESLLYKYCPAESRKTKYYKKMGISATDAECSFTIDTRNVKKIIKKQIEKVIGSIIANFIISIIILCFLNDALNAPLIDEAFSWYAFGIAIVALLFAFWIEWMVHHPYFNYSTSSNSKVEVMDDGIHIVNKKKNTNNEKMIFIPFSEDFCILPEQVLGEYQNLLVFKLNSRRIRWKIGPVKHMLGLILEIRQKYEAWLDMHGYIVNPEHMIENYGNDHPYLKEIIPRLSKETPAPEEEPDPDYPPIEQITASSYIPNKLSGVELKERIKHSIDYYLNFIDEGEEFVDIYQFERETLQNALNKRVLKSHDFEIVFTEKRLIIFFKYGARSIPYKNITTVMLSGIDKDSEVIGRVDIHFKPSSDFADYEDIENPVTLKYLPFNSKFFALVKEYIGAPIDYYE